MNTRKKLTLIVTILLISLFAGCKPSSEEEAALADAALPTDVPTPTVIPTPLVAVSDDAPLSPRVLTTSPGGGQEISPNASLEIVFDHDMEVGATSAAWQLLDAQGQAVAGDITWPTPDTMRFTPAGDLESGATYTAVLTRLASSAEDVQMSEDFKFTVHVLGELEIKQVLPVDGTTEVEKTSMITVVFNHPIVPLQMAEEAGNLPEPLVITPAVNGKGEWINTSVYVFQPTEQLQSSTFYTVTVPAGLTDVNGATLAEGRQWTFSTTASTVQSYEMVDWGTNLEWGYSNVPLEQEFAINFNQPMRHAETEAAFSLTSQAGEPVLIDFSWDEDSTSMTITPTRNLALATTYNFVLNANAPDTGGSPLSEGVVWQFSTYPYPGVSGTEPANGETQSYYSVYTTVYFNSPMDIDSLDGKITLDPALDNGGEWTYNEWNWSMSCWGLEPATTYTLTVLPGGKDVYGNSITQAYASTFTTTNYSPSAYLEMPFSPVIFRADGPQEFYVRYVNVSEVNLNIYSLTPSKFLALVSGRESTYDYTPSTANMVSYWTQPNNGATNETTLKGLHLSNSAGDPLSPGFYFLTLGAWQGDNYIDYNRLVIVADSNITLKTSQTEGLAWLTDLESGEPISNAPVTFYEGDFTPLATGTTDADGLVHLDLPISEALYEARFALVDGQGSPHFALASNQWGSGVSPYDFGIWSNYYTTPNQPITYVYTDRPLYRPGHPVSFKGIVRLNDDLAYSLPPNNNVTVEILNYDYEVIYEKDLPLSGFGTFSGELLLDENAALGEYTIRVYFTGEEASIGGVSFSVAEYRKPEFQVDVSADRPDSLPGEEFSFTVGADYFSGGAVSEAEVYWTLTAAPYTFDPSGELSRYSFDDLERDIYYYDPYGSAGHAEIIASDVTTTDANGEVVITIPAELSEDGNSQTLTLEATITDIAKNDVSARESVTVHQSSIYVGVRPQTYLGTANSEETFELVTVGWDESTIPNQSVDVTVVERRWNSIQVQEADGSVHWDSTVEEIPVATFENVKTDSHGYASVSFTPPNGGVYKAIAATRDPDGNTATASAYMWVTGRDYIPWRQTDDRTLNLITDKDNYTPGETAEILITSPFSESVYALVTVERGHIRHAEVVQLTSNSTTYRLPITAEMSPNTYVSVSIIKGAESDGVPDFRTGMTEIQIDSDQKAVNVEITIDKEESGPGDTVTYSVRTTDHAGAPLSAEVSLALTDLATLSLTDPNTEPILDFFYDPQSLSVRTAIPINFNIENYNEKIQEQMALGMGMGSGGGGMKGISTYGVPGLREDFPDTAYWVADVITDANGSATVTITLPDNLTTWRMDGRAVTVDTRVGQTIIDLISTKPLLVRPQTPRFFVRGDSATLATVVRNNTGDDQTVKVGLNAEGVTITGDATQEVDIPDGQQAYVSWDVVVDSDADRVDLIFGAEGGGFTDASRPPLGTLEGGGIPVYRYVALETVGTAGILRGEGSQTEAISLPPYDDVSGDLTIQIDHTLSNAMMESLDYLKHYPYSCVEQTISRFLPNVLTTQALRAAGQSDPELEANLDEQVNTALQRLYNWQNADGGWGWWSSQESNEITTAYALLGLAEARNAGYSVSPNVITRATEYLGANLENVRSLESPYKLNRQSFILYTLARADQEWVMSLAVELFDQRQTMSLYARAYLAQTFHIINPGDPRIDTLISDFSNAAIISATGTHWEEDWNDYWNWNTDLRTTAIILGALTEIDPGSDLNVNAVRWLMTNRTAGHWATTQETAWSLMALANWVESTGELDANYQYSVYLNRDHLGNGIANAETLSEGVEIEIDVADMLVGELNRLAIGRTAGPGNLYYTAHLTASQPVEDLPALDRGIIISRSYYSLDNKETPITQAAQGELLMGKLTIVVPSTRRYVIIEDPLPAGLEAVNQDLKTSPQESIPDDYGFEDIGDYGWGWWYFDHTELRDEKVVISADYLPAGTYTYTYLVRASTVGMFHVIPPTAQEFYFPEVYGRGEGSLFRVDIGD